MNAILELTDQTGARLHIDFVTLGDAIDAMLFFAKAGMMPRLMRVEDLELRQQGVRSTVELA